MTGCRNLDPREERVRNGGCWAERRSRKNRRRAPGKGQEIGPEDKATLHACQGLECGTEVRDELRGFLAQNGPPDADSHCDCEIRTYINGAGIEAARAPAKDILPRQIAVFANLPRCRYFPRRNESASPPLPPRRPPAPP